ncbi:MAG: choice-of-anchor Q domain-containing protein [Planctomycetota bacterium]|jgi:hypothetical protein
MKRSVTLWLAVFATVICASAAADTHYVDQNSPNPAEPYASWETAAHDIQSAVDAAQKGDTVQVAAGTYEISSQIAVNKAITVQGAGAAETKIDAGGKCRCVVLSGGAALRGFTVTGGKAREGGGVQCGRGTTLAECTISNNTAERYGGGVSARGGKGGAPLITDCKIIGNRVTRFMHTDTPWGGGGVYANEAVTVRSCLIKDNEAAQRGGGIWLHSGGCRAENCTIVGNRAGGRRVRNPNGPGSMEEGGGGAYCDFGGMLLNCLLYGNSAKIGGGAVLSTNGRAKNCTIAGNTASRSGGGIQTLGVAWIVSSIVHGNTRGAKGEADDLYVSHYYHVDVHQLMLGRATAAHCCIGQVKLHVTRQRFYLGPTAGYDPKWYKNTFNKASCVEEDPKFVGPDKHNYRLKPDSPCVNAGRKEAWMDEWKDLDGKPRLQDTAVDMGAYEVQNDKRSETPTELPAETDEPPAETDEPPAETDEAPADGEEGEDAE